MTRFAWFFLLIAAASAAQSNPSSSPVIDIPHTFGPYAVGRVSYDWVDSARPETLSNVPNTSREITVDVWYPAEPARPGTHTAPYFPNADKIDKSPFAQTERDNWENLWPMIVSDNVHTAAYGNAPFAAGHASFPLIIFSHGYGVEAFAYTHQIEELVSQGYVVAAIHHTFEGGVTVFNDGRINPFSDTYPSSFSEMHTWLRRRVDVWAGDIRFTLDQITRLNMAPDHKAPFAGRIDVGRVGVFGHSMGGFAAGRVCELDQRIKACLSQDGMLIDGPILRYDGGHLLTQSYLFMRSRSEPPSDEELAAMHLTRKQSDQRRAEFEAIINKEIQDCAGSAYQVIVGTPGIGHFSFTDHPFLQAVGKPQGTAKALKSLRVIEAYTDAFFDKFLNGAHDTLLDREPARDSEVEIKRYSR